MLADALETNAAFVQKVTKVLTVTVQKWPFKDKEIETWSMLKVQWNTVTPFMTTVPISGVPAAVWTQVVPFYPVQSLSIDSTDPSYYKV